MSEQPNSQQISQQSLHSIRIKQQNTEKIYRQISQSARIKKQQDQYGQQSNEQEQQQQIYESIANLNSTQQLKKRLHIPKKSQISNFIIKTYRILQDPINSAIIEWTDEGNAFIVKNKQNFQNQILPKYFKHKKFSSFVRQLNMYDFHKIRKQKQIPIFKHKYFKEGCVQMLCRIKRKSGQEGNTGLMEDDGDNMGTQNNIGQTKSYIPSLAQLAEKPMVSTYSLKSKQQLPYQSIITSQPSIGLFGGLSGNNSNELDQLIIQNEQLANSISELSHEQLSLELQIQKKRQKLLKILNVLSNCQLSSNKQSNGNAQHGMVSEQNQNYEGQNNYQSQNADNQQTYTLRDLQNHFSSDEDPLSFSSYYSYLSKTYSHLKANIVKISSQPKQEMKIQSS